MNAGAPGHAALSLIDTVLAEKPRRNDEALSAATMYLATFRDRLITDWRANGISAVERRRLGHVNSVITVVLGTHFPLGAIPWDELHKARAWLAEAVAADEPAA